jgi:hypothetical protein
MTTKMKLNERDFDKRAIRAIRDTVATPSPVKHLAQLVADQEAAAHPAQLKLSADARRLKANFKRDGKILGEQISAATEALNRRWGGSHGIDLGTLLPLPRERLHVFGADRAGTGGPFFYGLTWGLIEGGTGGAGIGVGTNLRDGTFWASHFVHGSSELSSFAGIGVRLTPGLDPCWLSVRPFVNWRGTDILSHRVFDSQLSPRGWGVAGAQIGIHVQSWDRAGREFRTDGVKWVPVWERSEINPSGSLNHSGSVDTRDLRLDVLASGDRTYAIWVSCRAFVITQAKFGLDIWSSASMSCELPYLIVEEVAI